MDRKIYLNGGVLVTVSILAVSGISNFSKAHSLPAHLLEICRYDDISEISF